MRTGATPRSGVARTKVRGAGKRSETHPYSIDQTLFLTPFGRIQCTAHSKVSRDNLMSLFVRVPKA
jgi:hypothetical protein